MEKLKISNSIDFYNFILHYDISNYNNHKFKEDDLGIVMVSIDNLENKLLVVTGSNTNFIFSDYSNKLPSKYDTIGSCLGCIYEALTDDTIRVSIVV